MKPTLLQRYLNPSINAAAANDNKTHSILETLVAEISGTDKGTYGVRIMNKVIADQEKRGETGVHTNESCVFIPERWPRQNPERLGLAVATAGHELRRLRDEFGDYAAPGSRLRYAAFAEAATHIFEEFEEREEDDYATPYAAYDIYLLLDKHVSRRWVLQNTTKLGAAASAEAAMAAKHSFRWGWKPAFGTYDLEQFRIALTDTLLAEENANTNDKSYGHLGKLLRHALATAQSFTPSTPKSTIATAAVAIHDEARKHCINRYLPMLEDTACGLQSPYQEIHQRAFVTHPHSQMLPQINAPVSAKYLTQSVEGYAQRDELSRLLRRMIPRAMGPVRAYEGDMLDVGEHALACMQRAIKGYAEPRKMFIDDTLDGNAVVRAAIVLDESDAMRIAGNYTQAQEVAAVLCDAWKQSDLRTGKVKAITGLYAASDRLRPIVKLGDTRKEISTRTIQNISPRAGSDLINALDGIAAEFRGYNRGTNIAAIISHGDPAGREEELRNRIEVLRAANIIPLLLTPKRTIEAAQDAGWPFVVRMDSRRTFLPDLENALLQAGAIKH